MCLRPNSCIIPCAKSTQSLAKQHSSGQVTGHRGSALTWRINNKAFEWASNALFSLLICAPFAQTNCFLSNGRGKDGEKRTESEVLIRWRRPTANTFVRTLFLSFSPSFSFTLRWINSLILWSPHFNSLQLREGVWPDCFRSWFTFCQLEKVGKLGSFQDIL